MLDAIIKIRTAVEGTSLRGFTLYELEEEKLLSEADRMINLSALQQLVREGALDYTPRKVTRCIEGKARFWYEPVFRRTEKWS